MDTTQADPLLAGIQQQMTGGSQEPPVSAPPPPMNEGSEQTSSPKVGLRPEPLDIDPETAEGLARSINQSIQAALGDRAGLDETLDYWNDLYEMVTEPRDEPWENASSICMPVTAGALNDVRARLMAAVFVKTPYVVSGKTDEAAMHQEEVARYYNTLFYSEEFLRAHDDAIHFSLRDGTSYIYTPWVKRVATRAMIEALPVLDEAGQPIVDPKTGKVKRKPQKRMVEIVEKNGVFPQAVELRDLILIPASSQSVDDADAVAFKVYFTETDLLEMVDSGDMWGDAVQKVIDFTQPGVNELTQDQQGTSTYEMSGTINVGDSAATSVIGKDGKNLRLRTNLEFWMYFTSEYDLSGDGRAEENVAFYHQPSNTLCGMAAFEYWNGKRPFIEMFAGLRRPGRAYGRGIPELTRSLQEEDNALTNSRLDYIDLLIGAPRYHTRNVDMETQDQSWGPNADYVVDGKDDIGMLLQGYQVPVASMEEQQQIEAKAKALVGVGTPGQASGGSGKMSAKSGAAWQASQNVIIDMMAMSVRWSMKKVLEYTHSLTIQYGYEDEDAGAVYEGGKKLKLDPEVVVLPYSLDVSGLTGGLDQTEQYQKTMTAYSLLRQDPLVAGDLGKWWYVVKMVLEQLGRPDIPKIIGDQNEAKQKQQQQEAAAKQKADMEMQLQMASHAKNPSPASKPQNGQQNGQQQPQAPPQQGLGVMGG